MRPLIIDDTAKQKLASIKAFAETHRSDKASIDRRIHKLEPPPGEIEGHVANLQMGYRVVFTIEQARDETWYRHVSVSVSDPAKLPNEYACSEIMQLLGFINPALQAGEWHPDIIVHVAEPGAVNLLEKIDHEL